MTSEELIKKWSGIVDLDKENASMLPCLLLEPFTSEDAERIKKEREDHVEN